MEITSLLIYGLAIWRVSSLLVWEDGPWGILLQFRARFVYLSDLDWNIIGKRKGFIAELFSCVWCLSFWLSFLWMIAWHFFPTVVYYGSMPLALSAVAILVEKRARN